MKPVGEVFDSSWRARSKVLRVNKNKVNNMVLEKHYLGKWPAEIFLTLGLLIDGKCCGTIIFASAPRSIAELYDGEVIELSRLWISDKVPMNSESYLIGRAIRYIKKEHKNIKTIVSFADPKQEHIGVVYKASNFKQENHESKNLFSYSLR